MDEEVAECCNINLSCHLPQRRVGVCAGAARRNSIKALGPAILGKTGLVEEDEPSLRAQPPELRLRMPF